MNEFLYNILNWIRGGVGSWGWSIVVFTIMIRVLLTPLDYKSRAGMRRTQKLQPQLAALQKKYAKDKEKLNAKTAELYRKEHINPLSSCLPLLLTWPILIAVFGAMRAAANGELLNQVTQILNGQEPVMEHFLWIKNLWMPDNMFYTALPDENTLRAVSSGEWLKWFGGIRDNLPALLQELNLTEASFEGNNLAATIRSIVDAMKTVEFYRNGIAAIPGYTVPLVNWSVPHMYNGFLILPILSAVSQIVMTKVMGGGGNAPVADPDAPGAGTGKFMQWFFPLFSLWICIGYSAAFALYWVAGNLVSMVQTLAINKYLDSKDEKAAPVAGEGSVK